MFVAFLLAAATALPRAKAVDPVSWFSPDNYPAEALKKGIEGSVGFEVDVDANGNPTACRITVSSGSQVLDHATCDIVRSKGHFLPGRGSDGKPVAGQYKNVTIWRLSDHVRPTAIDPVSWFSPDSYPAEALKKGIEGSVGFEVDVDADGNPTACRIIASSGFQVLDQTTCEIVRSKGRFLPALARDGKPVAGQYKNVAIWRMPDFTEPAYQATILDFSRDPDHPICRTESQGPPVDTPSCPMLLGQAGYLKQLASKYVKIAYMVAVTSGNVQAFQGEPDWGARISFMSGDDYYLKGAVPFACVSGVAEGMAAGIDPCAGFPGPHSISEQDKRRARRTRFEVSAFAVPRPASQ